MFLTRLTRHSLKGGLGIIALVAIVVGYNFGDRVAPSLSVEACEQRGRANQVSVVVCPPGLSDAELRQAGRKACPLAGACTAWIWNDGLKAPVDAGNRMTRGHRETAIAVWTSETGTLTRR